MADGANDAGGQFGSSGMDPSAMTDPTGQKQKQQQQQDRAQARPGLIGDLVKGAGKSVLAPIAKGMGETIRDMLMGPGGRREEKRSEAKEDFKEESTFQADQKEKEGEKRDVLGLLSDKINQGISLSPGDTQSLMQLGVPRPVIDVMNSTAAATRDNFTAMQRDFQAGKYGDPNDPEHQQQWNYMTAMMHANPKMVPALTEFMKTSEKMRVLDKQAVLKNATNVFNQALIGQRQEKMEGERFGHQEALEGQREGHAEKMESRRESFSAGMEGVRAGHREKEDRYRTQLDVFRDRLKAQLGASVGGGKVGAAAIKGLESVSGAHTMINTKKLGAQKFHPTPDQAQALMDGANQSQIDLNPSMGAVDAFNQSGFVFKGSDGPQAAKGIDDLFGQLSKAGQLDPGAARQFTKQYAQATTLGDEDLATKLLFNATNLITDETSKQMIQGSLQHLIIIQKESEQRLAQMKASQMGDVDEEVPEPDDN